MTPCIEWKGATNNKGYGHRYIDGVYYLAHRAAYLAAGNTLEPGQVVRHLCHNRKCVNVEHLAAGTHLDNAKDSLGKWGRKGRTPREERIADIKAGMSDREIAKKHGTSPGAIWNLRNRLKVRT